MPEGRVARPRADDYRDSRRGDGNAPGCCRGHLVEPPIGIEPMTYSLRDRAEQVSRNTAPHLPREMLRLLRSEVGRVLTDGGTTGARRTAPSRGGSVRFPRWRRLLCESVALELA